MSGKSKPRVEKASEDGAIVVKKYANRRLYNTASSSYVTLDDLSNMVKTGIDFVVYDAKSGEDITRSVLTQIIFEQESRGPNLLPIQFLRRLIRFYGDNVQAFVPSYLEASMEAFARQQESIREQFAETWNTPRGMDALSEQARQNMALFDQALRMFTPYDGAEGKDDGAAGSASSGGSDTAALEELQRQMAAMQAKLDKLAKPDDA